MTVVSEFERGQADPPRGRSEARSKRVEKRSKGVRSPANRTLVCDTVYIKVPMYTDLEKLLLPIDLGCCYLKEFVLFCFA